MVNCQRIANLLDNRQFLDLAPAQQAEVSEHLRGCDVCSSEWRAAKVLWEVSTLPAPAPRPGLFAEAMRLAASASGGLDVRARKSRRSASFWLGAGVGGVIAASLVAAVMSFGLAPQSESAGSVSGIRIALNEPRDVGVAIDSAEALTGAEIRVVLTGGVRLAGFADRSEIRWRTDLDRGVNRLSLPLIAVTPGGGQVLVEVEHASKRQIFVVNVGVDAVQDDLATVASESAGLVARAGTPDWSPYVKWRERPAVADV